MWQTITMSSDGQTIILGAKLGRLYISTDGGSSWNETQPAGNEDKDWKTTSISSGGDTIIAVIPYNKIYISTNKGTNWNEVNFPNSENMYFSSFSMSFDGKKFIIGIYDNSFFGRLVLTTDGGIHGMKQILLALTMATGHLSQ